MSPDIRLKFEGGDTPSSVMVFDKSGKVDPRRLVELANLAAGRAANSRIAHRLFGHSLDTISKEGLVRTGQSWWEHTYKNATSDKDALDKFLAFTRAQGEPFHGMATTAPACLIYYGAARWADQAFPTITMGEKLCAALCGTEVPEEWYDEIQPPWKAFVIEIPGADPPLLTVFDPEHQVRSRATRILVQHAVADDGYAEWWWMLFTEHDQHCWRQGTIREVLRPVQFTEKETERYRVNAGDAFAEEVDRDERIYHVISRLVFNSILTLTDPDRVRAVGSSHKHYEQRKATGNDRTGPPEQRVFIIGKPIKLDCRQALRDYLEGRKGTSFKITTQTLVRGYWRWQPYGPKHSLRRRQFIEPYWKGPEGGVIPVREHNLGEGESEK